MIKKSNLLYINMNIIMNYKNLLQEYFQKKKLPIPQYESFRVGGTDTLPEWQSTVIIYDNTKYMGEKCLKKTAAENSAAFIALKLIEKQEVINPYDYKVNTAILIDIENLPKFYEEIPSYDLSNQNLTVYGFIGQYHPLSPKINNYKMIKVISPSTRPDGTDTCMQVYTGMLLMLEKHEHYIIATKDHFGSALVEMITNPNLGWVAKTAQLAINYKNI